MTLVLLGGGGHASDVLSVLEAQRARGSIIEPIYVADDAWAKPERFDDRTGVELVESIEAAVSLGPFLVCVGYPDGRRAVHGVAVEAGGQSAGPAVHPDSSVHPTVRLDDGVVVLGQTWISPQARIAAHTHVCYGATIGHDTEIGSFSSVMPGACIGGDLTIGEGVLIGANATVLQGLTVGDGARIGAGAVVIRDVPAGETVVGVPAQVA